MNRYKKVIGKKIGKLVKKFNILFAIPLTLLIMAQAHGSIIYIRPGATISQIQNAIDNANPGNTILLRAGTYIINAPLTFRSNIIFRGEWSGNGWLS